MLINASTKEFTPVNNAIPSYDIAFGHSLIHDSPSHIVTSIDELSYIDEETQWGVIVGSTVGDHNLSSASSLIYENYR